MNINGTDQTVSINRPVRIQKVLPDGVQHLYFFDKGNVDPNSTKSGLSSARQRNAIYMAFRCWADDGPTLNAGLAAL